MKFYFIAVFLIMAVIQLHGQGVDFKTENLDQTLADAKHKQKIVFVDVFTEWCGPCKQMDKFVFSAPVVGAFFNDTFLNHKLNAEKGEGVSFVKKYKVDAYPTYLFLSDDGTLIYRLSGMQRTDELIKAGRVALAERLDSKKIGSWQDEYVLKNKNVSFVRAYLQKRANLQMSSDSELEAFFNLLNPEQRLLKENLMVMLANTNSLKTDSHTLSFLIKNYNRIDADTVLARPLFKITELSLRTAAHEACFSNDLLKFHAVIALNNELEPTNKVYKPQGEYEEMFYRLTRNFEMYKKVTVPYLLKRLKDPITDREVANRFSNMLNNSGKLLVSNFSDAETLLQAKTMVEKAILLAPDIQPTRFLLFNTYAHILYKTGMRQDAIFYAEKAVAIAGEAEDYEDFKDQLTRDLKAMQER